MDVNILVVLISTLVAAYGSPTFNAQSQSNQNVVPGVFIPVDTLRTIQAGNGNTRQIGNPDQIRPYNGNLNTPLIGLRSNPEYQANSNMQLGAYNIPEDQPILNQQPTVTNQHSLLNRPNLMANQQPIILNQQPSLNNQQPVLLTESSLTNQQGALNRQGIANVQPVLLNSQPNQPLMYQNGQTGQPTLVANPSIISAANIGQRDIAAINPTNDNNQIMNSDSNQGTLYAMVPVNTQNSVPNPNGNTYLIPVQQVPANQIYALNTGK